MVVRVETVPFQQGEFGMVVSPPFASPKYGSDLEYSPVPCGKQAFHEELRTGDQKAGVFERNGLDMGLRGRGECHDGGLDFQEALSQEEGADGLENQGASFEKGPLVGEVLPFAHPGYDFTFST
jgi:hypothetical protein